MFNRTSEGFFGKIPAKSGLDRHEGLANQGKNQSHNLSQPSRFNLYEKLDKIGNLRNGPSDLSSPFLGKSHFNPLEVIAIGDEEDESMLSLAKQCKSINRKVAYFNKDHQSNGSGGFIEGSLSTHDGQMTTETSLMNSTKFQHRKLPQQPRRYPNHSNAQQKLGAYETGPYRDHRLLDKYRHSGPQPQLNSRDIEEIEVSDDDEELPVSAPTRPVPQNRCLPAQQVPALPLPKHMNTPLTMMTQENISSCRPETIRHQREIEWGTKDKQSSEEEDLIAQPPVCQTPREKEQEKEKLKEKEVVKAPENDRFLKTLESLTSKFKTANRLSQLVSSSKLGPKEAFSQRYQTLEVLGEGGSCVVKKVLDLNDNQIYAAKTCKNPGQGSLKKEAKILKMLSHPNIVLSHGIFESLSGVIFCLT